jgi:hypothetical protein
LLPGHAPRWSWWPSRIPGIDLEAKGPPLAYSFAGLPPSEYTLSFWVKFRDIGEQKGVCSLWHQPYDDPLMVLVDDGHLWARTMIGRSYVTGGARVELSRWLHIAVVRAGERLGLYLDGRLIGTVRVPAVLHSTSGVFALGGTVDTRAPAVPGRYTGLALTDRALTAAEVARVFRAGYGAPFAP